MDLNFKKTALLIIDMQKAFVQSGAALCIDQAAATVPAISRLADHMRCKGAKVFWVIRQYAADRIITIQSFHEHSSTAIVSCV